jgi:hypothetical protein
LVSSDLPSRVWSLDDPDYPLLVCVRAVKGAVETTKASFPGGGKHAGRHKGGGPKEKSASVGSRR